MKLFGKTWNPASLFSKKEDEATEKKIRFLSNVIRTHAFAKLTAQDKLLSLGKLIMVFRADCGFTPRSLEKTMESLNEEVTRQNNKLWQATYSSPSQK